jgi:hypothetical protein
MIFDLILQLYFHNSSFFHVLIFHIHAFLVIFLIDTQYFDIFQSNLFGSFWVVFHILNMSHNFFSIKH